MLVAYLRRCDNVLAAADFDALLLRPSRNTFDAADAARADETLFGAFVWANALPADVLDFEPVDLLRIVLDALDAAFLPVTLEPMIDPVC